MSTPITHESLIGFGCKHKHGDVYLYFLKQGAFIYPPQIILFGKTSMLNLFDGEGGNSVSFVVDSIENLRIIIDSFVV